VDDATGVTQTVEAGAGAETVRTVDGAATETTVGPTADELRAGCDRFLLGHGERPPAVLLAEVHDVLGDVTADRYGAGGVVEELESEVAALLGKPAAVMMPSGTMAQQIALRVHADRTGRRTVLWHPTCHLALHEDQAIERLHGLHQRPVGDSRRLITLADLEEVAEYAGTLLIELPQREIGGQLPSWDDLVAQTALARSHGTALHLDGARLLESLPFYGRPAAEVAGLFDSVYLSLYKGLGGISGCVLAGEEQLVAEAREWRHRHGGTPFGLWPYAAAGLAGLRLRSARMPAYVEHARAIAAALSDLDGVRLVPDPPQTQMFHLHADRPADDLMAAVRRVAAEQKVWTWSWTFASETPGWSVVELAVGDATLEFTPVEVRDLVADVLRRP
jgi:threonine aldolase